MTREQKILNLANDLAADVANAQCKPFLLTALTTHIVRLLDEDSQFVRNLLENKFFT